MLPPKPLPITIASQVMRPPAAPGQERHATRVVARSSWNAQKRRESAHVSRIEATAGAQAGSTAADHDGVAKGHEGSVSNCDGEVHAGGGSTRAGTRLPCRLPLPSGPSEFDPQQYVRPVVSTRQPWKYPTLIC